MYQEDGNHDQAKKPRKDHSIFEEKQKEVIEWITDSAAV